MITSLTDLTVGVVALTAGEDIDVRVEVSRAGVLPGDDVLISLQPDEAALLGFQLRQRARQARAIGGGTR